MNSKFLRVCLCACVFVTWELALLKVLEAFQVIQKRKERNFSLKHFKLINTLHLGLIQFQ